MGRIGGLGFDSYYCWKPGAPIACCIQLLPAKIEHEQKHGGHTAACVCWFSRLRGGDECYILSLLLLLSCTLPAVQELESFTDDADGSAAAAASDGDDLDDFGLSGWGQFGSEEAVPEQSAARQTGRSKATKVGVRICLKG